MDVIKQFEISKYSGGEMEQMNDSVVVEYSLTVYLFGELLITMLCTPKSLKYLVTGFLFSEGIIESRDDILEIFICEKDGIALVTLTKERAQLAQKLEVKRTITSGCAKGQTIFSGAEEKLHKINNSIAIDFDKVLKLVGQFNKKSEIFLETGGVHSCALCSQDEIVLFEEDIGRHNALEKIFGAALLDDIHLEDKMVLTSGRASSEIISKAAKRGIPVIVSRSAPTDAAVDIARAVGITLIGFARGQRLNVYSQQEKELHT